VGFDCIERGLALLAGEKLNSQTDLIAGLRLIKEGEQFWLVTWNADLPGIDYPAIESGEMVEVTIPSIQILNSSWKLEVEEIFDTKLINFTPDTNNIDPFQAWLDVSVLDLPLSLRTRTPGDRIMPLGLNRQSVKISDLMINLKLPKRVRSTWPLVCSGSEIVWMPGYRISELVKVKPSTSRVIHLRLHRN
jgi:tRNA(Ile)-lysidine synthase